MTYIPAYRKCGYVGIILEHSQKKSHHFVGMESGMGTAAARSLSEKMNSIWLGWKEGRCCAVTLFALPLNP